jgi:hypothetical protein
LGGLPTLRNPLESLLHDEVLPEGSDPGVVGECRRPCARADRLTTRCGSSGSTQGRPAPVARSQAV